MSALGFEFKGDGGFLRVEILQRSRPGCAAYWDGNWLDARVRAEIPGFSVACPLSIRSDEIGAFLRELKALYETLKGQARFRTLEDALLIDLQSDRRGHLELTARVRYPVGIGATLEFALEMDQTYLPAVIKQIEEIMLRYPVVGQP